MQNINYMYLSDFVKSLIKDKAVCLLNQIKHPQAKIVIGNAASEIVQLNLITKLREKYKQLNKSEVAVLNKKEATKKTKRMKSYRSYSASFKQKTIKDIKELVNKYQLPLSRVISFQSKKLKIALKNIYRWLKMQKFQDKKSFNRNAKFPDMEKLLGQFIKKNPSAKRKRITEKAKEITKNLYPQQSNSFNFSQGWFQKFKRRHSQVFQKVEKFPQKNIKPNNYQLQSQMEEDSDCDFIQDDSMQVQFIGDEEPDKFQVQINSQQINYELKQQQIIPRHVQISLLDINDENYEFRQEKKLIQSQSRQLNQEDLTNLNIYL